MERCHLGQNARIRFHQGGIGLEFRGRFDVWPRRKGFCNFLPSSSARVPEKPPSVGRFLPHVPGAGLSHAESLRPAETPPRFRELCQARHRGAGRGAGPLSLPCSRALPGASLLRSRPRPRRKLGSIAVRILGRKLSVRREHRILVVQRWARSSAAIRPLWSRPRCIC